QIPTDAGSLDQVDLRGNGTLRKPLSFRHQQADDEAHGVEKGEEEDEIGRKPEGKNHDAIHAAFPCSAWRTVRCMLRPATVPRHDGSWPRACPRPGSQPCPPPDLEVAEHGSASRTACRAGASLRSAA